LELLKEFRENANKLSANLPADASQQSCVIKYPRVVFLGTASAMPTLTRNVTSILVSTSASKSLLLDCGDYAIGQMHKFFGPKYIDAELVKIKGIYVSHSHQDHCQGLFGVVKARQQAFKNLNMSYEKLLIIHPITINHILSVASKLMFSENFSDIASTIPTEIFLFDPKEQADVMQSRPALLGLRFANTEKYLRALGLVDLKTVMVPHIQYTYAICLHMEIKNENEKDEAAASGDNNHFKLVFSADCRPSEQLIKAGKDCDLLIHECTFDNFNYEKAVKTRHSTIGEALEVSKEMNARHTVLTHFSARYSRFLITDQMNVDKSTFAFDFMSVTPDELSLLNKTTISKLNILFKEKMVMYEKSNPAKRQVQSSNYLGSKR
jgi:ribonuclease Z